MVPLAGTLGHTLARCSCRCTSSSRTTRSLSECFSEVLKSTMVSSRTFLSFAQAVRSTSRIFWRSLYFSPTMPNSSWRSCSFSFSAWHSDYFKTCKDAAYTDLIEKTNLETCDLSLGRSPIFIICGIQISESLLICLTNLLELFHMASSSCQVNLRNF